MSRSLDRHRQGTLMFGTGSLLAAGFNLATVRDVPPNPGYVLVVDLGHVVDTEGAHFAASRVAASAATPGTTAPVIAAPAASASAAGTATSRTEAGAALGLGTTVIGSRRVLIGSSLFGHVYRSSLWILIGCRLSVR